jgi:predicted 2-oxoglutarate/Fe(II)-dependent dioxygenase YbiX
MEITDVVSTNEKLIFEFENFISNEECDYIVNWFKNTEKMPRNGAQSFFNGRQIDYGNVSDLNVKKLMNAFNLDATYLAKKTFNEEYLYPDYTDLVLWEPGSGMVVHSDNCDQEGNPNYCSWRNYSAVLYLNDDFLGGETFFPDHGPLFIKPKKGKLAIYPSGLEYSHGVTTVVNGNRYTMPIWFTRDKNYILT